MIAIIASDFNKKVVDGLLNGCHTALTEHGIPDTDRALFRVPGAFELPGLARKLMDTKRYEAIICLGVVIKGETDHYHYICEAVTQSIAQLNLRGRIPVIYGVLTCPEAKFAEARSGSDMDHNKGYEVGKAAVDTLRLWKAVDKAEKNRTVKRA